MKIDTGKLIKCHKGRPYISYFVKNGEYKGKEVRMYGEFRFCQQCKERFFSTLNRIHNGYGKFCSIFCTRKYNSGKNHYRWNNGTRRGDHGYIRTMNKTHPKADKTGYVYEHRIMAEKKIGRFIHKWEVVHHINEIRDDNRPENLMVMSRGEHKKLHMNMSR